MTRSHVLSRLPRDGRILFATRFLRLFAYGGLATVLLLYLVGIGFSAKRAGLLLSAALFGDTVISLALTTWADRWGRRRTLVAGAALMVLAAAAFAATRDPWILLAAAVVGVISPGGAEVGPFLAVEQAALAEITLEEDRTALLAWYNLAGSLATALGSLASGFAAQAMIRRGATHVEAYRAVVIGYGAFGLALAALFALLRSGVEPGAPPAAPVILGLHKSRSLVFRIAGLFSLDAFAGGFVLQSVVASWFHTRHGVGEGMLGAIFFGANLLAGVSALLAARIAKRIGLVNTMIFTHLPSNIFMILVPLMPTPPLAILMLQLRYSLSQMDVPTRQAWTMAIVSPDERSASAGVTGVARTTGSSLAPMLAGPLLANPALAGAPFFIAGGLKIVYDFLLWRKFRSVRPNAPTSAR